MNRFPRIRRKTGAVLIGFALLAGPMPSSLHAQDAGRRGEQRATMRQPRDGSREQRGRRERKPEPPVRLPTALPAMIPMEQVGPQPRAQSDREPRSVDLRPYAHVLHVAPDGKHRTITSALKAVVDASPKNRYAVLVAKGTYPESQVQMKRWTDLYGGFAPGDWKSRDVYLHAAVLDGRQSGPVVIGADDARLDGFVVTGGERNGHGAGILCDGVSPTIVNNIIVGNRTVNRRIEGGLGKQIASEGAAIALLSGSSAYVTNNIIAENTTEIGNAAGITARGNVRASILRNVFCNNISGVKDDTVFHGKNGSRSSPGGAIACSEESSPQISFNVIVMGAALNNNDGGGIWVEGNSQPVISYNWIVGNTSGDDGGGIYAMGNCYYDEQGERLDFSPDGPVRIEDNLIAGNNTVRGGPGGVRGSRYGRLELRRNCIVANERGGAEAAEGAFICVREQNVVADNGQRRSPASPSFRLVAEIAGRRFDARRCVTEVDVRQTVSAENLAGSAVRIGNQWSVVKSSDARTLTIWGRIAEQFANSDGNAKVEVLDGYYSSDGPVDQKR